jgi:hypothetical protein
MPLSRSTTIATAASEEGFKVDMISSALSTR